ncbi:cytochrome C oxidase subunit IV family protein [Bosea thiooxidans]
MWADTLTFRRLPLPVVLAALLVATGLSLLAAFHLPPGLRGSAIAVLSLAKVVLVVLGFMRLQRESRALAGALIGYAALICLLAGVRIALAGVS